MNGMAFREQVSVFSGQRSSVFQHSLFFFAMFHNPFRDMKPPTSNSSRSLLRSFLVTLLFEPFNFPSSRILARNPLLLKC